MVKPSFFSELKRRQIYRGGVMYVVAGWVVVQVATQVFPYFDIPNWAIRLVVVAILLGFPIALVCLWMFESVDPEDPEKHLVDRRQGGRDAGNTGSAELSRLMAAERAERQRQNEELISALAQLKAGHGGVAENAGTTPAALASTPQASPAQAMEPAPAPARKSKAGLLAGAVVVVLVLAGLWILFGPQAPSQAGAIPGELADKYVAPGFAQVERLGADLLRPLLKKLGIGIAPERVFTVLLVLAGALILRDFYHQMVSARRRKRQG